MKIVMWVLLTLILIGGVVAASYFLTRRRAPAIAKPQPPVAAKQTVARSRRITELRDLTLGLLENEEADQAIPLLEELQALAPGDPFAVQNLAVARLLKLVATDLKQGNEQTQDIEAAAQKSATALLQMQPHSADALTLSARVAGLVRDRQAELDYLKQAASQSDSVAANYYALYQALLPQRGPEARAQAVAALTAVVTTSPDNLFILPEAVFQLATEKDPRSIELLKTLQSLLQPFASAIETNSRINVLQLSQQGIDAGAKGDWPLVARSARIIGNVVKPEAVAQTDRLRLDRNTLEFMKLELSPGTLGELNLPPPQSDQEFSSRFSELVPIVSTDSPVTLVRAADLDLDGRIDLLAVEGANIHWWHADAAANGGWSEQPVQTAAAMLTGIALVDLDDDVMLPPGGQLPADEKRCHEADLDLVVFGTAGIQLFENVLAPNSATRHWQSRPAPESWATLTGIASVTPLDLEHDGDLDLIVVAEGKLQFWVNRGDWSFAEITDRSELPPADFRITSITTADWDRDLDSDIIVAGAQGCGMLENVRYGRFRWRPFPSEFDDAIAARQLEAVEYDGNASWDLLYNGPKHAGVLLTRTSPGQSSFLARIDLADAVGHHMLTGDLNNDGWLDVAAGGPQGIVYSGFSANAFRDISKTAAFPQRSTQGSVLGDLDQDGDLDVLAVSDSGVLLAKNKIEGGGHWLNLSLRAEQISGQTQSNSGRVNHYALGSMVECRAVGRYQAQVVRAGVTHFGLGAAKQAETIRVLWTNGIPRSIVQPEADTLICERQTLKGSCPYLYAWNGTEYRFVTDLLWAAPLGLKFGESTIAPWRDWEYLKVSGEQLQPINGEYRLQITEELWEAGYFDQVELLAVDHPAGLDVFTNEKVGPADLAPHRLHFVEKHVRPVAAAAANGAAVLAAVSDRDGVYATTYDRKIRQGLTTPHYLEVTFPEVPASEKLTLIATGWLRPTDTSLNVALSQNAALGGPKPLSLQTPTADGWRDAIPYTGFPGGKTKTIAIDVTGVLDHHDPRLRLACSQELYWDSVVLSVGDPTPAHTVTAVPLVSADLHFRGLSRIVPHPSNGPEFYDYQTVVPHSFWPPIDGEFTSYGPVRDQLIARDDQLVVLGAGDEIACVFRALPPPADGQVRDFVLHNVGWDKDADMNTVYGHAVAPLPFEAMTTYNGVSPETPPTTTERLTRRQHPRRFWRAMLHNEPQLALEPLSITPQGESD